MSDHTLFDRAALNPFRFTDPADRVSGEHYIYVLDISTGVVKAGFTSNVQKRISGHIATAAIYGAEVTAAWISVPHVSARSTEAELLRYCREVATERFGSEHFKGVTFVEVVEAAKQMEFYRIDGPRPELLLNTPRLAFKLIDVAEITGTPLIDLQRACVDGRLSYIDLGDAHLRLSRDQVLALMPSAAEHPLLIPSPTT